MRNREIQFFKKTAASGIIFLFSISIFADAAFCGVKVSSIPEFKIPEGPYYTPEPKAAITTKALKLKKISPVVTEPKRGEDISPVGQIPAYKPVVPSQPAVAEAPPVQTQPQTQAPAEQPSPDASRQPSQQPMPSTPQRPTGETLDLRTGNIQEGSAIKTPLLKRIDIERIGAAPYYEEYQGLRLAKYFTVAQRVEIFEEPKPIDAHILDAKKIRYVNANQPWDQVSQFRSQASVPIFTRAYGTEITVSDPNDKEGQIRYTHDYREIYGNQFPIYMQDNARNVNYKHEQWDQNEILIMHSKKIPGIDWNYTSNFGYRYSTMNAKNDGSTFAYYENRHTYFTYFSLAPTDRIEYFGQMEYFKSHRPNSSFTYNPDHYFWATELRMKSSDFKTSVIPRFSYSIDYYMPFYNRFKKYETQVRFGHDFTEKFKTASTVKYVFAERNDVDNTAPFYNAPNPINDCAAWTGIENRAQYNVYDRLWLQGGLDFSAGTNMSDFDNYGLLAGLEYYAPGWIRIDFGWRGNHYYNIEDFLSTLYFKFYLFM